MQQDAEGGIDLVSVDMHVKESPGLKIKEGRERELGREGGRKEKKKRKEKRTHSKITHHEEEKIHYNPENHNYICLFKNQLTRVFCKKKKKEQAN